MHKITDLSKSENKNNATLIFLEAIIDDIKSGRVSVIDGAVISANYKVDKTESVVIQLSLVGGD